MILCQYRRDPYYQTINFNDGTLPENCCVRQDSMTTFPQPDVMPQTDFMN